MAVVFANNASSKLSGALGIGDTVLSVESVDAGEFPTPSAGDWFPLTLVDPAGNMEIVKATARSGTSITVVRAQEGTTAKAFASGSAVDLRVTSASLLGLIQSLNASYLSSGTTAIARGGTGAGTAANARSNLGAASALTNFSATGAGLSGGGTLESDRQFSLNLAALPIVAAADLSIPRVVVTNGNSAGSQSRMPPDQFLSAIGGARTISSGPGIRGGGNLASDLTLTIDLAGLPVSTALSLPRVVVTDGATTGSEGRMEASDFRSAFGCLSALDLVYSGSSTSNTTFPIGSVIACKVASLPGRNAVVAPRLSTGDVTIFTSAGSAALLGGVWRARGAITSDTALIERTA